FAEAAAQDAQLLVFPEYAAMELCSLLPQALHSDLARQLQEMQALLPLYLDSYRQLAQEYGLTVVAGSFPEQVQLDGGTRFVNRAYLVHADGRLDFQDKQIMTRFECEEWSIEPGTGIKVLDSAVGRLGICICYDSEFPLLARQQIENGADLILVPSVTETLSGYHRVRIGSQARALENQCYVVHAPLVGEAGWSPAVDVNNGCAGVYTPVDHGFPSDGILLQGTLNQPGWIFADLDLEQTRQIRSTGHVLNHRDWERQQERLAYPGS
ncbi:MAG: carbon-nitrogen hydrolase family protein, partial [Thiolinea sp.]